MKYVQTVFLLVLLVYASVFTPPIHAAVVASPTVKPMVTKEATSAPSPQEMQPPKEDYLLPYPGILPDHPLYFLKTLRDNLLEALIVDPARKAEFYLLMADKHLSMTISLLDQSKSTFVSDVVAKDASYMTKSVASMTTVRQSGKMLSNSALDKLEKSLVKHEQVLTGLLSKTSGSGEQSAITAALGVVKKLEQDVAALKL
jgi:hypothetical protein